VGQRLEHFRRPLQGQQQTHFLAASAWCFLQISAVHSTMLPVPPLNPSTQISAAHSTTLPGPPSTPSTPVLHSANITASPAANLPPVIPPGMNTFQDASGWPHSYDGPQLTVQGQMYNFQPIHGNHHNNPALQYVLQPRYGMSLPTVQRSRKDHTPIKPSSKRRRKFTHIFPQSQNLI
jgi:hypothetical protein